MKRFFIQLFCCLWALVLFTACQEEEEVLPYGGMTLSLAEVEVEVDSRSVPSALGHFSPAEFEIKIEDESDQHVVYHSAFTEEMINLRPATYRVTAYWGDNVLLGLDTPYFEGVSTGVEVASKENKQVEVACKVANALLSVRYANPSVFDQLYSDYAVVVHNGNASVRIEDITKSAYFPAGSAIMVCFEGMLKSNGQRVETQLTHADFPPTLGAGQHLILSLKAANIQPEISQVEVRRETISAHIPVSWLPKPKMTATGFENNQVTIVETTTGKARVDFNLAMPLEDVKFRFAFEDVRFTALNDRDFFLSRPEDRVELENTLSLVLPEIGAPIAGVDFSGLVNLVQTNGGATTNNRVTLDVKANTRWSSEDASVNRVYNIQCVKPQFELTCHPGNIWTKEFTFNPLTAADVVTGDFDKIQSNLVYQFSTDQTVWTDFSKGEFLKSGLVPHTTYYVRAKYRGAVDSEVKTITTREADHTLDTGFETWSSDDFRYWKRWFLNANKEWKTEGWCSMNYYTSGNNNSLAYCSNSGTEPTSDRRSGNYAAEVKTIGWGSGNTAAGGWSVIYNVTPGEVFLGKIDDSFNPVYGYNSFSSRPTGIRFYYKYYPKGNRKFRVEISLYNGSNVIAQNAYEGGAINSYTEKILDFVYDPQMVEKEVTGIKIRLSSGENTTGELDKGAISAAARHTGNKLYVDDLSLIYDK